MQAQNADPLRLYSAALRPILQDPRPADVVLREFFAGHRELGRRDRGQIAETVFDVLRNRRLYEHLAASGPGPLDRRLALLSLARRDPTVPRHDRFRRDQDLSRWLDKAVAVDVGALPAAIRLSLPDWLWDELVVAYGEPRALALGAALLRPAPLDLRANLLKTDRDAAIAALAGEGLAARPLPTAPQAIRMDGKPALERTRVFEGGEVEVQDAGSQLIALMVAPRRGQTVVDFCAGAGGKTLAIAAAMRSSGQVYACDVSAERLARLRPRLKRSGATNVQPFGIEHERDRKLGRLAGRVDAVLVDAPCSGTGTLRRNPDLKSHLSPQAVERLVATQKAVLSAAARLVREGGALIYATCSLLPAENDAIRDWFGAQHPGWRIESARDVLSRQGAKVDLPEHESALRLAPDLHDTDGFYAVRWIRDTGEQDRR